ncbi:MAG: hypothetical protein EOO90_28290 [Pedobacter sp.]|nr:MAG: hypothetical protein EOO90_28290 [Pedobacter sp.]
MNIPIQLSREEIDYVTVVARCDEVDISEVIEGLVMRGALVMKRDHDIRAKTTQESAKDFASEVGKDMEIDLYVQAYAALKGCTDVEMARDFFTQGLIHYKWLTAEYQQILEIARSIKRRRESGK